MIGGLAIAVSIGSVTAAPFAALTVSKVNPERLIRIMGLASIVLGSVTLVITFIF